MSDEAAPSTRGGAGNDGEGEPGGERVRDGDGHRERDSDRTGDSGGRAGGGPRDAGYDDWLDAVAGGEAYALGCPEGHGSLPPRRVCPHCAGELTETPLAEPGTVLARTAVHVSTPQFAAETPYVTAIAEFGDVRITGLVRSEAVDPTGTGGDVSADDREHVLSDAAVEIGDAVTVDVEAPDDGHRILVFRPA